MKKEAEREMIASKPRLWRGGAKILPPLPGCQHTLGVWAVLEAVEELGIEDRAVLLGGTGCTIEVPALVDLDGMQCPHGRAPDIASTMKRVVGSEAVVITYQDDADCIAIGTESLLHSASRGERITVVMANSGGYAGSGWQMAPRGGKVVSPVVHQPTTAIPINAIDLLCGMKGVVYAARGTVTSSANYQQVKGYIKAALRKQMEGAGFSFVEMLLVCPTDTARWKLTPEESIKWIEEELVAQYPLGEFKNIAKIES